MTRDRDKKRVGILTISDVGEDVKDTVKTFLDTLVHDSLITDDDSITIMLSSDTENKSGEAIYTGTAGDFPKEGAAE